MKTILYILQKEFIQVFRNKTMLPIIFAVPIVQLLILVNAATFELKKVSMYVVDQDMSSTSRKLIATFEGSPFFDIQGASFNYKEGEKRLKANTSDVVLSIPYGFEKEVYRGTTAKVQFMVDAVDGMAAGLINAYSSQIIMGFNKKTGALINGQMSGIPIRSIAVTTSFWYNPELNYKTYMVPGILVILVTIISMFLTALNVVREKEIGTIEQINVTPIRKHHFIIGKLVPFWFIALFELGFGLIIGVLIFHVPIVGSLWVLFSFAAIYLIATLALGLFLSTISNTQQQVMFVAFFLLITFVLMSGIFTPTESMPRWAQIFNIINPISYFMKVIRLVLLKGSGFADIWREFVAMAIFATTAITLAIWKYRKTN